MPRLVDVAIAPPEHRVDQALAVDFARTTFGAAFKDLERLLPLFTHAGVATRHFCVPPEWFEREHSFAEKNAVYLEVAPRLCEQAARELFARTGLAPADVDRVLFVNTTGLATPSLDARLINLLGLRREVQRTPLWGLGCAGGAAGLAHAFHHLVGHPRQRVLLFAAELCSLTFLRGDTSKSNLVATALFSDGAAAALLSGDETGDPGFELVDARSVLYPDSLDVMGWHVVEAGLQVVFNRRIPAIVEQHGAAELDALLARSSLARDALAEHLIHPGGQKVLEAYARAYGLPLTAFGYSASVLRDFGNMSSVTVLYVLERYLRAHRPGRAGHALITALGPGFSSESLLMRL
jgi:alkylresorcinol/alkylpyrone synthase